MVEIRGGSIIGRETELVEQPVVRERIAVADAQMVHQRSIGAEDIVIVCHVSGIIHIRFILIHIIGSPRGKAIVQQQALLPV